MAKVVYELRSDGGQSGDLTFEWPDGTDPADYIWNGVELLDGALESGEPLTLELGGRVFNGVRVMDKFIEPSKGGH